MDASTIGERGAVIDRRAHQRMAELDHRCRHDESRGFGRSKGVSGNVQRRPGSQHRRRITDAVRGGDEQEHLCVARQRTYLPQEPSLDELADGKRFGDRRAGEVIGRQLAAELDEREGIAASFAHDPIREQWAEWTADHGAEQLVRVCRHRARAGGGLGPRRWARPDRTARVPRTAARSDPHTHGGRRSAKTLIDSRSSHCVSSTMHSSGRSRAASPSSVSAANPTRKTSPRPSLRSPNADSRASRCGSGNWSSAGKSGNEEAVQRGESHSHLRLDADDSEHGEIAGVRDGIVEERRLPDPDFAAQHECTGTAGSGRVENAIDRRPLRTAAEEHEPTRTGRAPSRSGGQVQPVRCRRLHVLGDSTRRCRPSCSSLNPTDAEAPIMDTLRFTSSQHDSDAVPVSLGDLVASIRGRIVTPGEPGWDAARQAWNLAVDQRPALVAMPLDLDDVRAIVQYARHHRLGSRRREPATAPGRSAHSPTRSCCRRDTCAASKSTRPGGSLASRRERSGTRSPRQRPRSGCIPSRARRPTSASSGTRSAAA